MIKMQAFIAFLCFSLVAFAVKAGKPINICTDTNFWYPFTYVKDETKQVTGLHIDIINKALTNAGYEPHYKALPWKQCLSEAKAGHFDAVATVSYKTDRTSYLDYPADASQNGKSKERVTQVEYVVITPVKDAKGNPSTYTYQGDIKTIPSPVRIPTGYSIVENLEQAGLKVEENPHSIDNFKKLVKEKTGSVVDLQDLTQHLASQPEFSGQLKIVSDPIFSKSYFLAFAKKGNLTTEDQKKIWEAIAKVRENSEQMGQFLEKY